MVSNRIGIMVAGFSVALTGAWVPVHAAGGDMDQRIEMLQHELDALKDELDRARAEREALKREQAQAQEQAKVAADTAAKQAVEASKTWPEASFGGQYRINFYSADNQNNTVVGNKNNQTSQRVRIRQNVDLKFSEQFKTHLQMELQHTTDNVTTSDQRRGGNSTDISVRHAVMDYTFRPDNAFDGTNARLGIVPLSDHFHDTLFSSDWDYNPVAVQLKDLPGGPGRLRVFAANLEEGSESNVDDDFVHYQLDYLVPFGEGTGVVLTGTALNIADATGGNDSWHYNYGIGGHMALGGDMRVNGFVVGSRTDEALLGGTDNASGVALLAELTGSFGPGHFGILASHATGEDDGTGFLMPMAFAQTFGYWGYTGILTVQGATDTGFDFDGVNISNNGYGMTTVQAKYAFPIMPRLSGYLGAGWFGNTDAQNRDSTVGYDSLAMGTYRFNKVFALDLGVAYAKLKDSASGYFQGVQNPGGGGPAFNQDEGKDRNKVAFFGRIQAEF